MRNVEIERPQLRINVDVGAEAMESDHHRLRSWHQQQYWKRESLSKPSVFCEWYIICLLVTSHLNSVCNSCVSLILGKLQGPMWKFYGQHHTSKMSNSTLWPLWFMRQFHMHLSHFIFIVI